MYRKALTIPLLALAAFAAPPGPRGESGRAEAQAAQAAGRLRRVTDSQGNRYEVDEKGTIYTDGSRAPLAGRPHASAENIGYYLNKFGALMGAGHTQDAIFMGAEILDIPEEGKGIRGVKHAVSLTLSRIVAAEDLNTAIPFVRHERNGLVVYRNRLMDIEVRYPASFQSKDDFRGDAGRMTAAFLELLAAGPEGRGMPVRLTVSAEVLEVPFQEHVKTSLSNYETAQRVSMRPVKPPLRVGARRYHAEHSDGYQEDVVFFKHPRSEIAYAASFRCADRQCAPMLMHYEFLVKNIRVGSIPPLRYQIEPPPALRD